MDTVVVYNSQPRILRLGKPDFKIVPGENDVPKSVLQANLDAKNGVVKTWFKLGYLQIRKDVKKARPLADDLSKATAAKAKEIIKSTDNVAVLKGWARKEGRSTVLQAITRRLDELESSEPTARSEEKSEGEGESPEE